MQKTKKKKQTKKEVDYRCWTPLKPVPLSQGEEQKEEEQESRRGTRGGGRGEGEKK